MSAEALFWKQAGEAVRSSLPEIVYLFDSFLRRKAAKFRAISQRGTKFKRVTLTAALAVACGVVSYGIYRLDPFEGLEGIMPTPERAVWTAIIPLIAAFLAYWLVRRPLQAPILSTFLNLGLVTCIALTVIPGVVSLAGANASALASDIRQFRAGRAGGTPVHRIICTTLEERAETSVLMRRLNRNSEQLMQNSRLLMANTESLRENAELLRPNGERLAALRARIDSAGGPEQADPLIVQEFMRTMSEGLPIVRRGLEIQREGLAIHRQGFALREEGLAIQDRALDLEYRQTTALYRLIGAYPVAAAFLVMATVAGLLMWLFSAVIAWRLVVTPLPTRKRRVLVGILLVFVILLVSIGSSLLRSGLLEVFVQELPTREMLEAQLRTQFQTSGPMCGRLNNHGLW